MDKIEKYKNKHIAIYEYGIYLREYLDELTDYDICGIIHEEYLSGSRYGIKIIPYNAILDSCAEVIIIVSDTMATLSIFRKLKELCKGKVILLDRLGNDLFDLYEEIDNFEKTFYVSEYEQLKRLIDVHDVISFDVFDTLITRNILEPKDVYEVVGNKVKSLGIDICDFVKKRIEAEQAVECVSPDINQIYKMFAEKTNVSFEDAEKIKMLEIDTEKALITPRTDMVDLLRYALGVNKKVYLISDMYINKDILRELLREKKIEGYHDVFVSCDYHQTKYTDLYHEFKEKVSSGSCLHIGDNFQADGLCAIVHGIDVAIIKSGLRLFKESAYKHIIGKVESINDRILMGMFVATVFNSPFAVERESGKALVKEVQCFIKAFIAPLLTQFVLWLVECASDYDNILFSARDGYLIQDLYKTALKHLNKTGLPEGIYFSASRMLCAGASMETENDIAWMVGAPFKCSEEEMLKERFSLADDEVKPYGDEYLNVVEYALAHKDTIYKKAEELKHNYLNYMEQLGLKEHEHYAFFDFVTCGTCQYYLHKIIPYNLEGLYCCYYNSISGEKRVIPYRAYIENKDYYKKESFFFGNYLFFETFMTSFEATTIGMTEQGKPILDKENRTTDDFKYIETVHEAVKEYFRDYLNIFVQDVGRVEFSITDELMSFSTKEYTIVNCKELTNLAIIDDFGKNIISVSLK